MDTLSLASFEALRKRLGCASRQDVYKLCRQFGYHNVSPAIKGMVNAK